MVNVVVTPDFWVSCTLPEGMVERWLVPEGTNVSADQALAELRIERDLLVLKAPAAGKLLIDSQINSIIEPGSVVGRICPAT